MVILSTGGGGEDAGDVGGWEDGVVESPMCFVDGERDMVSAAVLVARLDGAVRTSKFVFVRDSNTVLATKSLGVRERLSLLSWMVCELQVPISLPRNLAILVALVAGVMVSASPAMRCNGTCTPAHTSFPAIPPTGEPVE